MDRYLPFRSNATHHRVQRYPVQKPMTKTNDKEQARQQIHDEAVKEISVAKEVANRLLVRKLSKSNGRKKESPKQTTIEKLTETKG